MFALDSKNFHGSENSGRRTLLAIMVLERRYLQTRRVPPEVQEPPFPICHNGEVKFSYRCQLCRDLVRILQAHKENNCAGFRIHRRVKKCEKEENDGQ